jgi:hypothetical protein
MLLSVLMAAEQSETHEILDHLNTRKTGSNSFRRMDRICMFAFSESYKMSSSSAFIGSALLRVLVQNYF